MAHKIFLIHILAFAVMVVIGFCGRCKCQRFECILRPCKKDQLTEDESAPFGKGLEQKDLRQTKRMNLENILPNYKKENFKDLMDEE